MLRPRLTRAVRRCTEALLIAVFAACTAGERAGRTGSDSIAASDPSSWMPTLAPRGEYGCVSCNGPELLDLIGGLGAGADRSFVVLQRSAPLVRVWRLDADSVVGFGTSGQGPGELDRPTDVALFHDSVLVADMRGGIKVFKRTGEYLGSIESPSPGRFPATFSSSPSGTRIVWAFDSYTNCVRHKNIVVLNAITGAKDTVPMPTGPPPFELGQDGWADASVAVSDDGRVALGVGRMDYGLAVLSADGTVLRVGGRDVERHPSSRELINRLRRSASDGLGCDRPPNEREISYLPHFVGPDALQFDERGRLWVELPRRDGSDGTTFDVFSPDLAYLGELRVEPRLVTFRIGAGILVGATREAVTRVPVIKVWDIRDRTER